MDAMSESPMHTRFTGGLLIGSIVALFAWRLVIVEAILGPIDPADNLPGWQRDVLASGLLLGSIIATTGLTLLARQLRATSVGRWALLGQYACQAAPPVLAIRMFGILLSPSFQVLFTVFAALTTASWVIFGLALWRAGVLRWLGLVISILGCSSWSWPARSSSSSCSARSCPWASAWCSGGGRQQCHLSSEDAVSAAGAGPAALPVCGTVV
jgi:hypothetical protein